MVAALDRLIATEGGIWRTDIPAWEDGKAVYHARAQGLTQLISMHHYNAVWRGDERELIPFCRHEGVIGAYSPLARGFLWSRPRHKA